MRREGGARGGGRRAAVRCGRRGLAGRRGEADPAGAQLRGPGECGGPGGAPTASARRARLPAEPGAASAPLPPLLGCVRLGSPLLGARRAATATGKPAAGLRNLRSRPGEMYLFEIEPEVQPCTVTA